MKISGGHRSWSTDLVDLNIFDKQIFELSFRPAIIRDPLHLDDEPRVRYYSKHVRAVSRVDTCGAINRRCCTWYMYLHAHGWITLTCWPGIRAPSWLC